MPDERECVLLSTIHGGKGGEWRVVFLTGFEEGLLPHAGSLAPDASTGSLEEEQRLAYVAVTRAQERLYVTACHSRCGEPRRPSRFLRGLPLERSTRAA